MAQDGLVATGRDPLGRLNGITGSIPLNPTTGISAKGKLEAMWQERLFFRVHAHGLDMPASRRVSNWAGGHLSPAAQITCRISFRLIENAGFEIFPEMLNPIGFIADGVFPCNLC